MGTTIGSGGSGRGTKIQVLPSQTNTGPKIADIVVGGETIELKSPQFSGTISEQDLDTIQQAVEIADDVNKLKDDKVDRSDIDALVDDSGEETGTLSDDDECVPSSKLVKSEIAKISAKVGEFDEEEEGSIAEVLFGKEGELTPVEIAYKATSYSPRSGMIRKTNDIYYCQAYSANTGAVCNNPGLVLFPCKGGEKYKVHVTKTITTSSSSALIAYTDQTSVMNFGTGSKQVTLVHALTASTKGVEMTVDNIIPSADGYLVVSYDGIDGTGATCSGFPTVYHYEAEGAEEGVVEALGNVTDRLDAIAPTGSDILDLNTDKEYSEKIGAARWDEDGKKVVTFAHISDVHGDTANMKRFIDFAEHWKTKGCVDEIVDTGDLNDSATSDQYDGWLDAMKAVVGFNNVLTINGNHDTDILSTSERWYKKIGKPSYDRLFKEHAESTSTDPWGVTFPSTASTAYSCYYYKDYNSSPKLRAIFVDVMAWDVNQQTWYNSLLADALTNGYHVIVFAHYVSGLKEWVDHPYSFSHGDSSVSGNFSGEMFVYQGYPSGKSDLIANGSLKSLSENMQSFIDGGGKFVGYVMGHTHKNAVGRLKSYPSQYFFVITSGKNGNCHDFPATGRAADNFQLISVNTDKKTLVLTKVGGIFNSVGNRVETLGYDYGKSMLIGGSQRTPSDSLTQEQVTALLALLD